MQQTNEEQKSSNIQDPCSGAMSIGLVGAAVTAIGANIMGHSVHDEAMTVLTGGVITGALAGTFGCCLPDTQNANLGMKIAFGVLKAGLGLAATLTAPLMGETILNLGTSWSDTVVDGLVGGSVVAAGVIGLAATVVVGAGVLSCCNGTLFAQRNPTRDTTATPLPVAVAVENEVSINDVSIAANRV
jgi:hypothetical protein